MDKVAEKESTYRSAQEPVEIRGPSTPPMLPRSAQEDSIWFSALALLSCD
jgi:hypothetical protein